MGRKRRERVEHHKQSLGEQIENPETYGVRTQPRPEKKHRRSGAGSDEEEEVPGALSNRILAVAREQQEEVAAEGEKETEGFAGGAREALAAAMQGLAGAASDSDDEYQGDDFSDPGSAGWEEEYEAEVNGQDEAALEAFMNPTAKGQKQKTLTDVIMEKIREKQAAAGLSAVPRYVYFFSLDVDFICT
jgi:essential nuclear protein 1